MFQYCFINYDKCTTIIHNVNNMGNWGVQRVCGNSLYFLTDFPIKLTALKNLIFKNLYKFTIK